MDDNNENSTRMDLYEWLQCGVLAIVCGIFIFVFVGRTIGVDGISMMNTLHDRDRVIMTSLFYSPSNGDIIVFHSPAEHFHGTPLVKRVIAIEGQSIDINFETGAVYVDGIVIDEPHIDELTSRRNGFEGPTVVPDGHVFVMGDNRQFSTDSRSRDVGMVDMRYILGRVLLVAVPGSDQFASRDWGRIGFVR